MIHGLAGTERVLKTKNRSKKSVAANRGGQRSKHAKSTPEKKLAAMPAVTARTKKPQIARRASKPKPSAKAKKSPEKIPKAPARAYSRSTLGKLFGLSRNQCAYPNCPNPIIIPGTKQSDEAIIGHICHIYAVSVRGPRGKPGLTATQLNAFKNLILMCRDHHGEVDAQYETYPAVTLFRWKKDHEAKATKGTPQALKEEALIERHHSFGEFSDRQINEELLRIRRARFLPGFDAPGQAKILARQVREAKLSAGSRGTRAVALAWCARLLAHGDTVELAKELLNESVTLSQTAEGAIAKAFIASVTDPDKAVAELARNRSGESLSAALMIQAIKGGPKKALGWAKVGGLSISDFCADGKFTFLAKTLEEQEWTQARSLVSELSTSDFAQVPALQLLAAFSHLLTAVPDELKPIVFSQIPLEVDTFLLAARPEDLAERREARDLFKKVEQFARLVGVAGISDAASDYALWLGLVDQESEAAATTELRDSMSDPATSIRRLNLAFRFGLVTDFAAIEERIDRRVALSGKAGPEEAQARFALAYTKQDAKSAAYFMEQHRAEFFEHLNKAQVTLVEIQILVAAGLLDTAQKRLDEAVREDYIGPYAKQLERLIAEGPDGDGVRSRRETYEAAETLSNLMNLIHALEHGKLWAELLPYAQKLFVLSPSVDTLDRVVHCLNELKRHRELLSIMTENGDLVQQSEKLKTYWAWSLFHEGRLLESHAALKQLADQSDVNTRALRVNLAISGGTWHDLLGFCQELWDERASHSAVDLMHAAQLSIAVSGPHSRGLVEAALQKEPENAGLLAKAYFEATSAGWEQTREVSDWLKRAAKLSGEDGPIQSMSLKEILERKPKWDENSINAWTLLGKGEIPTVAAGQLINRSLVELYLSPSLVNISEEDVRKRAIVYAFSGARFIAQTIKPKSLALDFAALVTFARLGLLDKVLLHYSLVVPHATLGWLFQERKKATFHQPSRIKSAERVKELRATDVLYVISPPPSSDEKLRAQVGVDLAAMLSQAREKSTPESKILVVRSSPLLRLSADFREEADITGYEKFICSCSAVIDRLKLKAVLTVSEEETARDYLQLTERRWPDEQVIDDRTEIYLDDLSVSYFQTTGVLDKLKAAGIKAYISQSEDDEANGLIALDRLGDQQLAYIEKIRSALERGIESGRVRVGRMTNEGLSDDSGILHPTYKTLGLATMADAIVIDDRGINRIQALNDEGRVTPLLISLDVLDLMQEAGTLAEGEVFEHRTLLRRAGYQLIPVTDAELTYHMTRAQVINGEFVETAELRAIRESLLRARMGAIIQLPAEMNVLNRTLAALTRAIKGTWEQTSDRKEAQLRADYLLPMTDPRNWAASAEKGVGNTFAHSVYGVFAFQLLIPPANADADTRRAYHEWATSRILNPIKTYQPEIYAWLLEQFKRWAAAQADTVAREFASRT
jgi:hypothetical protein